MALWNAPERRDPLDVLADSPVASNAPADGGRRGRLGRDACAARDRPGARGRAIRGRMETLRSVARLELGRHGRDGRRANARRPRARIHRDLVLVEDRAAAHLRARHDVARTHGAARAAGDGVFIRGEARSRRAHPRLARAAVARPHDRLRRRDLGKLVAAHMSVDSILGSIQGSAVAEWMRDTNPAMQVVESAHVLAAVMVLGTVLIADARLLGLADTRRAFTRISRETLPLTWAAFALAVVTGSLMFTTSAPTYFYNTAFEFKALAL